MVLLNQMMIAVSPLLAAFSVGGATVYPTLLMEHFRVQNSSSLVDLHIKSWIGSIYGVAGIPVILLPALTQRLGRRFGFLTTCLLILLGWTLSFCSSSTAEILLSEVFLGLGVNSLLPLSFLCMSEMLSPRHRPLCMQLFGLTQCLGMACAGILGRFCHYKTVALTMLGPVAAALCISVFWPESPSWLACRGQFVKCETAFIKLHGNDEISAKELSDLITAQRENLTRTPSERGLHDLWAQISRRDFYIPALHTFVLMTLLYWSGCDAAIIYFLDMAAKSTTDADATFYAVIVMYVILVVGMVVTDLLIARFDHKKVLLGSAFFVTVFLCCACVVTALQTFGVLAKDSILCLIFILLCISSATCGVDSLVFVISSELMPVKHRSPGGALYIIFNCSLYAFSQKVSPYLILYIGLWGTFLLYAINALLCSLFVWKYVPETKQRSLQEIEDFYTYGKFVARNTEEFSLLVGKIEKPDRELDLLKYTE